MTGRRESTFLLLALVVAVLYRLHVAIQLRDLAP